MGILIFPRSSNEGRTILCLYTLINVGFADSMPLAYHAKKIVAPKSQTPCPPDFTRTVQESPVPKQAIQEANTRYPESERAPSISNSIKSIQALAAVAIDSLKSNPDQPSIQETRIDRVFAGRSPAGNELETNYRSFQASSASRWQPEGGEYSEARAIADRVFQVLAAKTQQITDYSKRIQDLERENAILSERLQYETAMNTRGQQSRNEEITILNTKLEATTQAAAQLHAQQTAVIEEQNRQIESLRLEITQLKMGASSLSSPSIKRTESTTRPALSASKLPSTLPKVPPQPTPAAPDTSSRPRPSRRGRPPSTSSSRAPADLPSDALPPRRVLHSMESPIRSALADAPGAAGAADKAGQTVLCVHERDFDTNGVFYRLGMRDDGSWENPARTGRVAVYCEAGARGRELFAGECKEDVLERAVRGDSSGCFALAEGWFAVWLGDGTRLRPSHYTIRNGGGLTNALTGWILEVPRPRPPLKRAKFAQFAQNSEVVARLSQAGSSRPPRPPFAPALESHRSVTRGRANKERVRRLRGGAGPGAQREVRTRGRQPVRPRCCG